ncbi:Scd6-like Sm domain-containing protein [Auriculariales sp. MPI-PUGE-AT-0066]|nr:Scd6-like Sm domain-containing protein [Auriculariales sp. MPI-PUGE-AT-0066]
MSAQTFIGRMISLTSHSDIRYTGILEGIDQQNSTITLKNVFSLGTENRQPMGTPNYVPPNSTPYNHVVFKAQNVKDISVDDPQAAANIPNDPAVLSAASVPQYQASGYAVPAPAGPQQAYPQGSQQPTAQPPRMAAGQNPAAPAPVNGRAPRAPKTNGAPHVDQVTRSMNNVHIDNSGRSNGGGGGSRRNHPHEGGPRAVTVPDTDFDFQSSNARFNKVAPVPSALAVDEDAETKTNPSDSDSEDVQKKPGSAAERDKFYNPTKSFFDTLSTAAPGAPGAPRGGGGGGREVAVVVVAAVAAAVVVATAVRRNVRRMLPHLARLAGLVS